MLMAGRSHTYAMPVVDRGFAEQGGQPVFGEQFPQGYPCRSSMKFAPLRPFFCTPLLLLAGIFVFFSGIRWGLPSRAADSFLFGDHAVWSGQKIMDLAGGWNPDARIGADVDANPTHRQSEGLTPLNFTDSQRAQIVRRYRLYSYQPDEWLTLRALSQLKGHHGDPRVYQYGGLWIYPVGVLLKVASFSGYIRLHPDPAYYIDHPALFGRFYIIARAYSAFWGLAGIFSVWLLLRRLDVRPAMAFCGALCFILMPVIVNGAHEAKPHLGGAVLLLWMIWAALGYVQTGRSFWRWAAAVFAGLAAAMVLSSVLGWIVLPVMVLLRPGSWKIRLGKIVGALAVAVAVYLLFNPFVAINAVAHRDILRSNLGNSSAMYPVSNAVGGLWNAIDLVGEGTSRLLAVMGLVGTVALLTVVPAADPAAANRVHPGGGLVWLVIAPALVIAVVMAVFGAGKPAEYGRFAMVTDIVLLVMGFVAADRFLRGRFERIAAPLILILSTGFFGVIYLRGFRRDASAHPSRLAQAQTLQRQLQTGAQILAMPNDPAPYCLPPVNLFEWHLYLLPRSGALRSDEMLPDVIVRPVDRPVRSVGGGLLLYELIPDPAPHAPFASTISWADKPMEMLRRRTPAAASSLAGIAEAP
jgi:hypothetical protein